VNFSKNFVVNYLQANDMTASTMRSFVKTHYRLDPVRPEEVSTLEMPVFEAQTRVLKQVKSLYMKRHLLKENKSSQAFIGHQSTETDDPFGSVLRKLRFQQGLDAAVVASNACISIWQLYELETGKEGLFYTPGLRRRAAERVAAFLKSDWNEICEGRVTPQTLQQNSARLHLISTQRPEFAEVRTYTNPSQQVAAELGTKIAADSDEAPLTIADLLRVAAV
jgi:hypothetical protein